MFSGMKYFIVHAHPEPTSLTGYLKDRAVSALEAAGHEVIVSDLYAMRFKAVADADDFPARTAGPLTYQSESAKSFREGTQSPDVIEEQRRLLWADNVIFQFPIWWYSMPAILKGWVDRVYAAGFAYGIGKHEGAHWGRRFGEGTLEGRRGMVMMNVGGRMAHYGPRGVNGTMDDLLWPIQHGIFFYPGIEVVPPTVFYEVSHASKDAVETMAQTYIERLLAMRTTELIHLRPQNNGDYNDVQVLKEGLGDVPTGHALHQRAPVFISNTYEGEAGNYRPRHIAPTSRG